MAVFVGLDCGGSSSRVLAVDGSGTVLFQGQSGAANLVSTPENRLRKNLSHATSGCPDADFVCGCFAGLISDETRLRGEEHLRHLFPNARLRAEPDYVAALYASPEDTDVCVIAGTGSLVCSAGPKGVVKSGGRGYILGDYGSGYQFGRDALIHYLDHRDRCSENLRRAVSDLFHAEDEGSIVSAVYKSQTPAGILAKLARALGTDARDGEAYALESIERNLTLLVEVVQQHVQMHVPGERVGISLAGGVWKIAAVLRDRFTELAGAALPDRHLAVSRIVRPPLYGAVELAKQLSGSHR